MIAVGIVALLALLAGAGLAFAARYFAVREDPLVEQIDALLPQTQCGQCGHPGCLPYAKAIAQQQEKINKCAPGGQHTRVKLAELLNVDLQQLNEDNLAEQPPIQVAFIDETACIGCTKCIHACPVDAIIGSRKMMHTVVSELCTGCQLCLPPCPTDCIEMHNLPIKQNQRGQSTINIKLLTEQEW